MIDIDVTHMVNEADEMQYLSGSIAELGDCAGRLTWDNCMRRAEEEPLLKPEQIDAARDYFRDFGAWDDEEIDAWTELEVQAIVIQEAASRIRELEHYEGYARAREWRENVSGALYFVGRAKVRRWYLSLSN
jgi:hypothetical protein